LTKTARLIEERLSSGSAVSGGLLSRELGVSRTAVFKHIERLRSQGYSIVSTHGQGYRLQPRFDGLLPLEVQGKLTTKTLGRTLETHKSLESTQSLLRTRAEEGAPEGHMVVALEQNAGKGRAGRPWHSPLGGLWFSLLLRPKIPMRELYLLTLLFGVAVTRSLRGYGLEPLLKWPNDVLLNGRKICGILLETSGEPDRADFVIVGIGINANFAVASLPEEMRSMSTSLLDVLGKRVDRAALVSSILRESEPLYGNASSVGFSGVIEEWKANSFTIGSEVEISSSGRLIRGVAIDMNPDGSLLVRTREGSENVYSGDLSYLKRRIA
jgi:BirA family biotin operon repressor/biotin-[acetyl-CoA-carboxylase] ligase